MPDINVNKLSEALNTKADIDLNNTGVFSTSEGGVVNLTSSTPANASGKEVTSADFFQSNLLNYTTNRILEIPQDIKLELNNGTLTLKAGSKLYVPNGVGKFDVITVPSDVVLNFGTSSGLYFPIYNPSNNAQSGWYIKTYSGAEAPTLSSTEQYGVWYDTTNNIIKQTSDNGSTWTGKYALPFVTVNLTSGSVTSIDQIFNGFGYIGSTVFVLPNVKCQSSIGRNADGTCTNLVRTVSSVLTYEAGPWNNATLYFLLWTNACEGQDVRRFTHNKEFSSQAATYSFDENENKWYFSNNSQAWHDSGFNLNIVGKFVIASGKITSFEPFTVDSILNSSLSNLSAAGEAKLKSNIQLVNELPTNHVAGVLYCIPEK